MKDRDNLAKALAGLVLVAILVVCGPQVFPAYAQQKVYKWRWVGSIPKALTQMPIWEEMCDEITRRSGGRLLVQAFHLGEHPYKGEEILSVVRDGLAEMGHSEGVYVTGEEVFMAAMDLPFLIPTMDQALRIKDRWVSELLQNYLKKKWNQFALSMWLVSGEAVHANRLLNSFEALRGQKIRVWSKETGDLVKTIGAVPVTVAFKETYPSLEKGIIDGGLTAIFAAHDYKWWEVVKYTTWWNFSFPTDFTVVNLKAFNKLPADLQAIVLKVGAEYEAKLQKELETYTYYCAAKGITKYAVTMTGLTPEFRSSLRERMKPVIWDDWAKRCPGDLGERFLKIVDEELRKQ